MARGSHGEQSLDDLKAEAWLAAHTIREEQGIDFDPEDEAFQRAILSNLSKAFGKFANRKMRFAIRLDQEDIGDNGDRAPNAIAARLAASDGYQPEIAAERAEEFASRDRYILQRFTEAVAYLRTLDHFDHDKRAIAAHLAIPISTLDARLRRAEMLADAQPSIFDGVEMVAADFVPKVGNVMKTSLSKRARFRRFCATSRPSQPQFFSRWGAVFARH